MVCNYLKLMRNKRVFFVFFVASIVAVLAEPIDKKIGVGRVNAGEHEKVTVEVDSVGSTVEAAKEACLQEAVRQVNGVVVRSDRRETTTLHSGNDDDSQNVDVSGNVRNTMKGIVLGYRVLSTQKQQDGLIFVKMRVDVAKFRSPFGLSSRPKLAVMPFRWSMVGYQVGVSRPELFRPGEMLARDVTSRVMRVFSQSGEYTMLSRTADSEMSAEEKLIDEHSPVSEKIKIGQRLGADFIVAGYLRDVVVADRVEKIRLTGGHIISRTLIDRACLKMTYQVLEVSTAQIAWMDDITIELDKRILDECEGVVDKAYARLLGALDEHIATAIDGSLLVGGGVAIGNGGVTVPVPKTRPVVQEKPKRSILQFGVR